MNEASPCLPRCYRRVTLFMVRRVTTFFVVLDRDSRDRPGQQLCEQGEFTLTLLLLLEPLLSLQRVKPEAACSDDTSGYRFQKNSDKKQTNKHFKFSNFEQQKGFPIFILYHKYIAHIYVSLRTRMITL